MRGTRLLLHETLHRHSVLLVNRTDQSVGTGILASAGRRLFILTAAHNLRNLDLRRLAVPGIAPSALPADERGMWMSHALDLAYIRLRRPGAIDPRLEPLQLVRPPLPVRGRRTGVAICGFPSSTLRLDERRAPERGGSFLVRGTLVGRRSWPAGITDNGKNPHDHFLLRALRPEPGPDVDPRGLSGAGVWSYHPLTQRDGRFRYSLFGIQTGVYRKEALLSGSFISPLLSEIFADIGV